MNRVQFILKTAADASSVESIGLVRAYCFCLSPRQASHILGMGHPLLLEVRSAMLRKVQDDIVQRCSPCHERLIAKLLKQLQSPDSRGRQSAAYCLASLLGVLPTSARHSIQELFVRSRYVGIRRRAYKSFSSEAELRQDIIEEAWNQFRDVECAWLITEYFPIPYLIENRETLVSVFSEGWQFARLYLRIGVASPHLLKELKRIDEVSYCYVCAKLARRLTEKEAKLIVDAHATDERLGLLIWSFGRLKLWKVLQYVQARIPSIQAQQLAELRASYGIKLDPQDLTSPP